MSIDTEMLASVRLAIMKLTVDTGHVPDAPQVARHLGMDVDKVRGCLLQLHAGHAIVLEPGNDDRIRMANPFAGVPTNFRATVSGRSWWGNCVWDGLGIIAGLGRSGELVSLCPDCAEEQRVVISNGDVESGSGVAAFGVPAARWWDDIVYT